MYPELDFPPISCKYKQAGNKVCIFDRIRKKFVVLTPEEWVRQHLVDFLLQHKNFPPSLLKIESGMKYNRLRKRSDVLAYDRNGSPLIIIECKSSGHKLTHPDLAQVSAYGASLKPRFLGLTNGMRHYFWKVNYESKTADPVRGFPSFDELLALT